MNQEMQNAQDDCLIAITDGRPIPGVALAKLPPWRALLIARVAERACVPLEHGDLETLRTHCMALASTSAGSKYDVLGEWWKPDA